MSEIALKSLRYRGDHPEDYQNSAYEPGQDDSEDHPPEYEDVDLSPNAANATKSEESTEKSARAGEYAVVTVDDNANETDNDDAANDNCFTKGLLDMQENCGTCYGKRKTLIKRIVLVVLLLLYFAYFGYAMYYEQLGNEGSIRLCWVTCLVVFLLLLRLFWHFAGDKITECSSGCTSKLAKHETLISWVLVAALFVAVIVFVFVDIFTNTKQTYNLVSGAGLIIYVLLLFVFSVSPAKVQWRAVAWGLGLQFLFAIIILRWRGGFIAFEWLGARVTEFLDYSDVGAEFLFGVGFREHFFAFKILPTIVFFSTAISILYYVGAMQVVVKYVAKAMQFAMGTTAGESLNAAGNIFVGQTEAPLLIRPLLPDMTKSELHAVMTGGFATIAGGVLAAYIGFGVPANHLLSASVMSAPAALAMAKLFYPETEKSKTRAEDVASVPKSDEVNIISAASNGASSSIKLVANIAVNLIAFLALLAFINATLTWFGHRVGLYNPPLTFELICSYVLYPFAFIMGVSPENCRQVAQLIGIKTFLNEFIAYERLAVLIGNRAVFENHVAQNGSWYTEFDDVMLVAPGGTDPVQTLVGGVMSIRSEAIATYALCGFANIGSIGIQLGGLGAMAPERRNDMARVVVRAMIAGNVACFMTACIAGLFFQE